MPYKDPEQHRACMRRSYQRHRAKKLAYESQYKKDNRDKINARRRRTRKTDEGRAKQRAERMRHRDKINARRRELRRLFPERRRTADKRYMDVNRDKINARRRANHAANPLPRREEARRYWERHPERVRARFQRWYRQNPLARLISQRNYRHANPEKPRIWNARRRLRELALPHTFTSDDHHFMMQYWQHSCAVCGNQEGLWHTLANDHWIAVTDPACTGTVPDNIIPLCHGRNGCNNSKHDTQDSKAWLIARYSPAKAKRILKAIETYFAIVRARKEAAAD